MSGLRSSGGRDIHEMTLRKDLLKRLKKFREVFSGVRSARSDVQFITTALYVKKIQSSLMNLCSKPHFPFWKLDNHVMDFILLGSDEAFKLFAVRVATVYDGSLVYVKAEHFAYSETCNLDFEELVWSEILGDIAGEVLFEAQMLRDAYGAGSRW